jgi:hypothetical protein
MRWIKANSSTKQITSLKDKKKRAKEDADDPSILRTVIVFNPLLWKEEIVNLIED